MSMLNWARREVDAISDNDEYLKECAKSALEAFEVICNQGHSGASVQLTKSILDKLIDGKPLSPITERDEWNLVHDANKSYTTYQCQRCSSLFKDVYEDGTVKYNDVNRVITYEDVGETTLPCHCGFISRYIDEKFPITLPYMSETYKVYTRTYSYIDGKEEYIPGEYDSMEVLYMITPTGDRIDINETYREDENGKMKLVTTE